MSFPNDKNKIMNTQNYQSIYTENGGQKSDQQNYDVQSWKSFDNYCLPNLSDQTKFISNEAVALDKSQLSGSDDGGENQTHMVVGS